MLPHFTNLSNLSPWTRTGRYILILNGIGDEVGSEKQPVNNVCFPSTVNSGYAPDGYSLCSVTVLSEAMEIFKGRPEELDATVRECLGEWFQDRRSDILEQWELKKIYYVSLLHPAAEKGSFGLWFVSWSSPLPTSMQVKNAQPSQFKGPFPASVSKLNYDPILAFRRDPNRCLLLIGPWR